MTKQAAVLLFLFILSNVLSAFAVRFVVGDIGGPGEIGQSGASSRFIPPTKDWLGPREVEQRERLQSYPPVVLLAVLAILVILLAMALFYKWKRPLT